MLNVYNSEGDLIAKYANPSLGAQESFKARVSKELRVTITTTEKQILNGTMQDMVVELEDWNGGKKLD